MKKVFMLFALACVGLPVAQTSADGQEPNHPHRVLFEIVTDWNKAYNSGDASKVASLYAEDAYYRTAHMFAHGRPAIESFCRRGIEAGVQANVGGPLRVFVPSGDFGYITTDYRETHAGATVHGRAVLIFRQVDGNWLIAAHETLVPDQP